MSNFLDKLFNRNNNPVAQNATTQQATTSDEVTPSEGVVCFIFSLQEPFEVSTSELKEGETLFSLLFRLGQDAGFINSEYVEEEDKTASDVLELLGSNTRVLVNGSQVLSDMKVSSGMTVKVVRIQGKNG